MTDTGVVKIHGKEYYTVSHRIKTFRETHPEYCLATEIISMNDDKVVMKATIANGDAVISTGFAEEVRDSSNINKTSALENCETSAVGRALAFFGLAGTEIASADEVAGAISQQKEQEAVQRLVRHNLAWREHEASLVAIKESLYNGDLSAAWEAWNEIPEDDRISLRVAATKGGVFSVEEGKLLKQASDEDFKDGVYQTIARKVNG